MNVQSFVELLRTDQYYIIIQIFNKIVNHKGQWMNWQSLAGVLPAATLCHIVWE